MSVRIYSTLTGREDEIVPIYPDGVLRMYVCGLTPKFHVHVGHARLFVAMDVIRRYLEYRGYRVKYVQNFTDIDDKIIQRAEDERSDAASTAEKYIQGYFEAMDPLNIRRADEYPRVTEYIDRIVEFVAGLIGTGHAYVVDGDVYFDVASFPEYGKLSHRDLNSQLVAARKELEPGKRDPRDFALWKAAKPGEPSWPSPWGEGRPGWHIECSTMARETLGDQLDVHGGGADLIFPHHENEIAQSEALTGKKPFARHWAHAGLVTTSGGEKMAHSLENFFMLRTVLEHYDPMAVRLYLVATHYRSPLQFAVEEGEDGVQATIRGVEEALTSLERVKRAVGGEPLEREGEFEEEAVKAFEAAMDVDFNTPGALAVVFDLVREVNRRRDAGAQQAEVDRARRTILHLLCVLGVEVRLEEPASQRSIEPFVDLLLEVRRKLREARQWALADDIRNRLGELGVKVEDRADGGSGWHVE